MPARSRAGGEGGHGEDVSKTIQNMLSASPGVIEKIKRLRKG